MALKVASSSSDLWASSSSRRFSSVMSVRTPTKPPSLVRRSSILNQRPSARRCSTGPCGSRWRASRAATHASVPSGAQSANCPAAATRRSRSSNRMPGSTGPQLAQMSR